MDAPRGPHRGLRKYVDNHPISVFVASRALVDPKWEKVHEEGCERRGEKTEQNVSLQTGQVGGRQEASTQTAPPSALARSLPRSTSSQPRKGCGIANVFQDKALTIAECRMFGSDSGLKLGSAA